MLRKEIRMPRLRAPRVAPPRLPNPRLRTPQLKIPSRAAAGITGLEIGATQLIAAQARLREGRVVADRVVARPTPIGLMRDGLVLEPERLATELKAMFAEYRLGKRVRVGLATPRTILRVIDLPPLEERDIRAALTMQAQERIPMPLERAVMDFHTVGLVDTPEGQRMRVIVVVTEKEGVERLLDALRAAGLRTEGIDLSIFAAIRSLATDGVDDEPVLYAQLGDLVNVAIAEGHLCRFTRQAPHGLAMVLDRLAETRSIPADQAHALLQETWAEGRSDAPLDGDVAGLLNRTASELGAELRAAAEFYASQFGSVAVTRGVVAGPLAPLPGFVPALAAASGLSLRCGETVGATDEALRNVDARIAPVASGLAVAEVRP